MHTADRETETARRARITAAHHDAHRFGVGVDRLWFSRLEAAAAGFLVAEAVAGIGQPGLLPGFDSGNKKSDITSLTSLL